MAASISQSVDTFQHDDLPHSARYIRLLQILNDNCPEDSAKVHCRITTWPIAYVPSYHAISYAWGDPESKKTILVNGKPFKVRTNCEFVLKQAFSYEKANHYWVDAICINQENLTEKSMQVSIMGHIFSQAAHVLACVGDHADDSDFLIAKLKQRRFAPFTYSQRGLSWKFLLQHRFSADLRFLHSVICFLERPYFTRLWVLQEIRNAQMATFLCGSDAIPVRFISRMSNQIYLGFYEILGFGKYPSVAPNIGSRVLVIRRFWTVQEYWRNSLHDSRPDRRLFDVITRANDVVGFGTIRYGISDLILVASALQCQEKMDRLFGLISLIEWGDSPPVIPDYTQTKFEVAVSFFKASISAWRHQTGPSGPLEIVWACEMAVKMLDLNIDSEGVSSSLQSRQIGPNWSFPLEACPIEYTHSRHDSYRAWRLSTEHLASNDSEFLTWSPPRSGRNTLLLPLWTRGGDWVVEADDICRYLVVREATEGFGGPVIGHALTPSGREFQATTAPRATFGIHWSPEDLVIYSVVQTEISRLISEGAEYSVDWVKALNTAVCNIQTPGSSYGFRCDDVCCRDL